MKLSVDKMMCGFEINSLQNFPQLGFLLVS